MSNAFCKVPIRKFNISQLKNDRRVLIVGKPGTGKSTLLHDILSYLYLEFDAGMAMSPTPDSTDMFKKFIPDSCIYEDYNAEKITELVQLLQELNDSGKKRRIFVILDDCMFDQGILKTKPMRKIHMNGRHLKICFINIAQYAIDVPKGLRGLIDYVFVLREPNVEYRINLWKNFFGIFANFEDFALAMDTCTNDRECMVIDNTVSTNNIEDCVFWYKARKDNPAFLLGNRNYWKLHYHLYKPRKIKFNDDGCPIPAFATKKSKAQLEREKEQREKEKQEQGQQQATATQRTRTKSRKGQQGAILTIEKRNEDGSMIIPEQPPPTHTGPPTTRNTMPPPITVPFQQPLPNVSANSRNTAINRMPVCNYEIGKF